MRAEPRYPRRAPVSIEFPRRRGGVAVSPRKIRVAAAASNAARNIGLRVRSAPAGAERVALGATDRRGRRARVPAQGRLPRLLGRKMETEARRGGFRARDVRGARGFAGRESNVLASLRPSRTRQSNAATISKTVSAADRGPAVGCHADIPRGADSLSRRRRRRGATWIFRGARIPCRGAAVEGGSRPRRGGRRADIPRRRGRRARTRAPRSDEDNEAEVGARRSTASRP